MIYNVNCLEYWRFVIPLENNRPAQRFFRHVAHMWRVVWDPFSVPHVYWEDTSSGRRQHFPPSRDRDISTQTYSQGCSFCGSVESQQFTGSFSCCDVSRENNEEDVVKENKSNTDSARKNEENKGGRKQYTNKINKKGVSRKDNERNKRETEDKTGITPGITRCEAEPESAVPEAKAKVKVVKSIIEGQEKSKTPPEIETGRTSAQRGDEVDIATKQRAIKLKNNEVTHIEQEFDQRLNSSAWPEQSYLRPRDEESKNWFKFGSDFKSPLQQIQPTDRDMPHKGEVSISGLARWDVWDAMRDLTEDLPLHLQQEVYSRLERFLDMGLLSYRPYHSMELRSQSTSSE